MAFFDIKPAVGITVEAAEGYDQEYSAMQALIEGYQNDYALFTGILYSDFKEYSMVHEGASAGEIVALREASISGFFNKIKEFFKKLWAKIKAIFRSFIAKFDSMFMKSGKALLKKYKKEIELKDTSELEVSYEKMKNADACRTTTITVSVADVATGDPKKALEDFDGEEFSCKVAKELAGVDISSMSEFDKEYHSVLFEDKEDRKWSEISGEVYALIEDDKALKTVKKAATTMDNTIAGIIKQLNKDEEKFSKDTKSDTEHPDIKMRYSADSEETSGSTVKVYSAGYKSANTKEGYLKKQAMVSLLSKRASATQVTVNKLTAAIVRESKFAVSQARSALAKAVAYRPKNEAAGLDTIADAIAYDPTIML